MNFGIMFARQRSGTGALGSVLDQHPELHYLGEVFHPGNLGQEKNFFTFKREQFRQRPKFTMPSDRIDEFIEFMGLYNQDGVIPIVDIKYSSIHNLNGDWQPLFGVPKIVDYARMNQIPIIHLRRENFVKTFVSGKLAEANKVWHAQNDAQIKVTSVEVDPRTLLRYLHSTAEEVAKFKSWVRGYDNLIDLEYEKIFEDGGVKPEVLEAVSDAFKISSFVDSKPGFVKQAPDDLSMSIENFDQVDEFLSTSKFQWMLAS